MMKQLFYISLFLLFSCKIIAQGGIRIMGAGIGLSSQPYVLLNGDISTYYNSFHKTKLENIYLTTGTKANYSVLYGSFSLGQRFGLGICNEIERNYLIYNNYGIEVNAMGYGLYANKNIVFGKKKHAFTLSPEISFLLMNHYGIDVLSRPLYMFLASCNFSTAWRPKEFIAKENKKYGAMSHFSANLLIGSFFYRERFGKNSGAYLHSVDFSIKYRLFSKQIISPEVGLGLLVAKNKNDINIFSDFPYITYGFYAKSTDVAPYLYTGFNLQTRNKIAFIANIGAWSAINFKGFGSYASLGVKYSINPKLAISLSPSLTNYFGSFWGKYTSFEKQTQNGSYLLTNNIKGLHESSSYGNAGNINIGIHF